MTVRNFDSSRHWEKPPVDPTKVRPKAQKAWDALSDALDEAHVTGENLPNCDGKEELFADRDFGLTDSMAAAMCGVGTEYECPLLKLCADYAELERPNGSVYGGKSYWRAEWEDV